MEKKLIPLAKIGAVHGVKGEVRVKPYGEAEMLNQYGKLETSEGTKFKITRMRPQKNMLVVKFEGINTRDEAQALNGIELFVDRAKLPAPDEDEFYIEDLIGMGVLYENGEQVGEVIAVQNFGAGDMLEISPGGKKGSVNSYYLPFTREVVPVLDFENNCLTVIPPAEVSERDEVEP